MRTDWSIIADQVMVCASVQPFEIASIITVRVAAPTINRHIFIHIRLHNHRNGGRQPCSICTMRHIQISAYNLALVGGPTVSKERVYIIRKTSIRTGVHHHVHGGRQPPNNWTMVLEISSRVYFCRPMIICTCVLHT